MEVVCKASYQITQVENWTELLVEAYCYSDPSHGNLIIMSNSLMLIQFTTACFTLRFTHITLMREFVAANERFICYVAELV